MSQAGARPNRTAVGNKQQGSKPSRPAGNLSDRKLKTMQSSLILGMIFLFLTQTGIARALGAFFASMLGYPQIQGGVATFVFFGPYLCFAFAFFMLDFMKNK